MIRIKSADEIKILKQGGKLLAQVLNIVKKQVQAGITTGELGEIAEEEIIKRGGRPSFKNYSSGRLTYPAALCASVNEQIVHGIPGEYILKEGDIVSLDLGMEYPAKNGLYADMAVTVPVGKISKEAKHLIRVADEALKIWIKKIKAGADMNEIARLVEEYIESQGFSVIKDLVGHGVGYAVHEDPQIPNFYMPGADLILKEGMVLALEPMVAAGGSRVRVGKDGWTISTADNSLASHAEHTVAVTKRGCLVLTK